MKKVTFILHGVSTTVEYETGDSLLDCALRNHLNPPYSCMEGVCSACIATVKSGKVQFAEDTILDEESAKSGKVLTCQSRLESDNLEADNSEKSILESDSNNVVIDYDDV